MPTKKESDKNYYRLLELVQAGMSLKMAKKKLGIKDNKF